MRPQPAPRAQTVPFKTAAGAWFWTMSALTARRDGAPARIDAGGFRPCEPDDVVKVLDRLYRQGRITLAHAAVLRVWGERGTAPNGANPAERTDARLWTKAMEHLEAPLRGKGIVA